MKDFYSSPWGTPPMGLPPKDGTVIIAIGLTLGGGSGPHAKRFTASIRWGKLQMREMWFNADDGFPLTVPIDLEPVILWWVISPNQVPFIL